MNQTIMIINGKNFYLLGVLPEIFEIMQRLCDAGEAGHDSVGRGRFGESVEGRVRKRGAGKMSPTLW